jgi:hypothetical protein
VEAKAQVQTLEETVAGLRAGVVDLVAWEEQAGHKTEAKQAQKRLKQA